MRITWVFCPFFCFCSVPVLILLSTSCFRGHPLSMCQEQAIGCTQKIQSCLWSWCANLFSPRRPDGHLWISKLIPPDQGPELRFPWWHAVADESKGPLLLTTENYQSLPFLEPWVDQNIRLLPGILLHPTSCVRIFNLQFEKTTTVSLRRLRMQCMHTFNPFTVPACNISGLKSAHMHLKTVYFLVL